MFWFSSYLKWTKSINLIDLIYIWNLDQHLSLINQDNLFISINWTAIKSRQNFSVYSRMVLLTVQYIRLRHRVDLLILARSFSIPLILQKCACNQVIAVELWFIEDSKVSHDEHSALNINWMKTLLQAQFRNITPDMCLEPTVCYISLLKLNSFRQIVFENLL